MEFTKPAFDLFEKVVGKAGLFELRGRLLAGRTSGLEGYSCCEKFYDTETQLLQYFDSKLTDSEKVILSNARKIRNKLLHCDFSPATDRIEKLIGKSLDGGVIHLNLDDYKATPVKGQSNPSLFGSFLEFWNSGALEEAYDVFCNGLKIYNRFF